MNQDAIPRRSRAAVFDPPKRWQHDQFFHATGSHHNVRYSHALPPGKPRGTIVLTHGYSENIDCYYEDIKRFQKLGLEVYALEWHGYGRSGRHDASRPDVPPPDGLANHVLDLQDFIATVVSPAAAKKDLPLIMCTNSMGAHFGLFHMHDYPGVFDGAIMSSPLFELKCPVSNIFRPIVKQFFNVASRTRLCDTKISRNWEDCDAPRKRKHDSSTAAEINHRRDFYNHARKTQYDAIMGAPTVGWVAAICRNIRILEKKDFLDKITTSVLIGCGSDDPFIDNKASERVARMLPHGAYVEIPGAGHTMWRQCNAPYEQWWAQVEKFVNKVIEDRRAPAAENGGIMSWREFFSFRHPTPV